MEELEEVWKSLVHQSDVEKLLLRKNGGKAVVEEYVSKLLHGDESNLKSREPSVGCYSDLLQSVFLEDLHSYIFRNWDHFVEVVRMDALEMLDFVLFFHQNSCSKCSAYLSAQCEWLTSHVTDHVIFAAANQPLRAPFPSLTLILKRTTVVEFLEMFRVLVVTTTEGTRRRLNESVVQTSQADFLEENTQETVAKCLLKRIEDHTLAPVISELYAAVLFRLKESGIDYTSNWLRILLEMFLSPEEKIRSVIREKSLPIILKDSKVMTDSLSIVDFFSNSALQDQTKFDAECLLRAKICLATLGVRYQHCKEPTMGKSKTLQSPWEQFIDRDTMIEGLLNVDKEIALSSLQLLVEHPKTTLPLPQQDLELCQSFLTATSNEPRPANRQQVLNTLKKLFVRMRDSGHVILKGRSQDNNTINVYQMFLEWLFHFSIRCLNVACCFGRRTMGLCVLSLLICEDHLKSQGKQIFAKKMEIPGWFLTSDVHAILMLLNDNFEQNQSLALQLLKWMPTSNLQSINFSEFLRTTWDFAKSNKPQDTISASYRVRFLASRGIPISITNSGGICVTNLLLQDMDINVKESTCLSWLRELCAEVTRELVIAEKSLVSAASNAPIYGLLTSIGGLLQELSKEKVQDTFDVFVSQTLIPLCLRVADLVAPVVHNMSPEGCLPVNLEDIFHTNDDANDPNHLSTGDWKIKEKCDEEKFRSTSQVVLVCCWRAQKEISSILAILISSFPTIFHHDAGLLSLVQQYFWKQLTECKHRGAFETSFNGFLKLCQYLWTTTDGNKTLDDWLNDIIVKSLLGDRAAMEKLCLTRRSAGLPYLVQGILGSEPQSRNFQSLEWTFAYLLPIAGNRVEELPSEYHNSITVESRVHACNILKGLYRDTRLGESVMPWVSAGFETAISAFADEGSWTVRNAASQLFSTLMTRTFGVPRIKDKGDSTLTARKNCMSSNEFFHRFPRLYPFMQEWLAMFWRESGDSNLIKNVILREWSLFPILILLSRLYPSRDSILSKGNGVESPAVEEVPSFTLSPFLNSLWKVCVESRILKVRELAAAAIASVSTKHECHVIQIVQSAWEILRKEGYSQNSVHGSLKVLHKMIFGKKCSIDDFDMSTTIIDFLDPQNLSRFTKWCPLNHKLLLDFFCILPEESLSHHSQAFLQFLLDYAQRFSYCTKSEDPEHQYEQKQRQHLTVKPTTVLFCKIANSCSHHADIDYSLLFEQATKLTEYVGIRLPYQWTKYYLCGVENLNHQLHHSWIKTAINVLTEHPNNTPDENLVKMASAVLRKLLKLNKTHKLVRDEMSQYVLQTIQQNSSKIKRTKIRDEVMCLLVDCLFSHSSFKEGLHQECLPQIMEWIVTSVASDAQFPQRLACQSAVEHMMKIISHCETLFGSDFVMQLCIAMVVGLQDEVEQIRQLYARLFCRLKNSNSRLFEMGVSTYENVVIMRGRSLNPTVCLQILVRDMFGVIMCPTNAVDNESAEKWTNYVSSLRNRKYCIDSLQGESQQPQNLFNAAASTNKSDQIEEGRLFDRSEANTFEESFLVELNCVDNNLSGHGSNSCIQFTPEELSLLPEYKQDWGDVLARL